ncbi:MAG: 16S rRNA (guanine(527)-N(7))-methyltransferase RsmG, partial [Defluviitaleaceae bacterium]|nr:16S rRNA (guanine(527)-N(7))-methyltransferase RsmG [Defluviitaleaceae bacterium]
MQPDLVEKWTAQHGVAITDTQRKRLATHQDMVLEKNRYMNLTAITDPVEFAVKHIIDSLTLLPYIPPALGITLADVGTGAGFPGLALAIVREDLQVTLVDSLRKRIVFLQEVVDTLGLQNVSCIHARAEDLAR